MKKDIYNAIYRLFEEGDYKLTLNVGGIKMRLYNPEDDDIDGKVWHRGIIANGRVYLIGDLYYDDLGPGNMAQLLRGDFDIIEGFAECIYKDIQKYLSKE